MDLFSDNAPPPELLEVSALGRESLSCRCDDQAKSQLEASKDAIKADTLVCHPLNVK